MARLPQRFQYTTDLVIIRGCIVPYAKDQWLFFCNDPAVNIEDPMSVEDLTECLSYLHRFQWLENDANFPGETIQRDGPSDQQIEELFDEIEPHSDDWQTCYQVVRDWCNNLTAESSAE